MTDHSTPLVSIGVPVYNEAAYVRGALASLRGQSFRDFELVISDNQSMDGTWELLVDEVRDDPRVRLFRQPENGGARVNFDFVLDQSRGRYFMWGSGHDRWAPNLLQELVATLEREPSVGLCAATTRWIDTAGELVSRPMEVLDTRGAASAAARLLCFCRSIQRCSAFYGLFRREMLLETSPWPSVIGYDLITLLRVAARSDVVTNQNTWWERRVTRALDPAESVARQINILGVRGYAAKFPYLTLRSATIGELSRAGGSARERCHLLAYGLWRWCLRREERRRLAREILSGWTSPAGV